MTADKRFSGGLAGSNPGLSETGREQVGATADWLVRLGEQVETVISSPVRRTRESAGIIAERWDRPVVEEPGFAEMEFGGWDGLTFAEVAERHRGHLDSWLGSTAVPAGRVDGEDAVGESFEEVEERVLDALRRTLDRHPGETVAVVSHVTPIKTLVAHALGAPLEALFRMELSPASVSVVSFHPGDAGAYRGSMRLFNALPSELAPRS